MLDLLIRIVAGLLGLGLLGTLFLYENEEGAIQSRLEAWWVRVDDLRRSALSKERAFLVAVAHVASVILDHAFGKKLFSATSLVVSSSYAIASGHFLAATLGLRSGHPLDHDVILVGIGAFLGGLLAARWRRSPSPCCRSG